MDMIYFRRLMFSGIDRYVQVTRTIRRHLFQATYSFFAHTRDGVLFANHTFGKIRTLQTAFHMAPLPAG